MFSNLSPGLQRTFQEAWKPQTDFTIGDIYCTWFKYRNSPLSVLTDDANCDAGLDGLTVTVVA